MSPDGVFLDLLSLEDMMVLLFYLILGVTELLWFLLFFYIVGVSLLNVPLSPIILEPIILGDIGSLNI